MRVSNVALALFFMAGAQLAAAAPPTSTSPAAGSQQSTASSTMGAKVKPVHVPTGPVGNQPVPQKAQTQPPVGASVGAPMEEAAQTGEIIRATHEDAGKKDSTHQPTKEKASRVVSERHRPMP